MKFKEKSSSRRPDFIIYLKREKDGSLFPVLVGEVVSDDVIEHSFQQLVYYQLEYLRPCALINSEKRLLGVVIDFRFGKFDCVSQEILVSQWFSECVFRGIRKKLRVSTSDRIEACHIYNNFFQYIINELRRGLTEQTTGIFFTKQSPTINSGLERAIEISNDIILFCNTEVCEYRVICSFLKSRSDIIISATNPHLNNFGDSVKVLLKISSAAFSGGGCNLIKFGEMLNNVFSRSQKDNFELLMIDLYLYLFKLTKKNLMVYSIQKYIDNGIACNNDRINLYWQKLQVREQFYKDVYQLAILAASRYHIFHWDIRPANILYNHNIIGELMHKFYVIDWESSLFWDPDSDNELADYYVDNIMNKIMDGRAPISQALIRKMDISYCIAFTLCELALKCIEK